MNKLGWLTISLVMALARGVGASHEGNASTPCCEASNGYACDEVYFSDGVDPTGCPESIDSRLPSPSPGDDTGTCAAGSLNPTRGGPAGCICVAGSCVAGDADQPLAPVSHEDCTAIGVEACCRAGMCHPVP